MIVPNTVNNKTYSNEILSCSSLFTRTRQNRIINASRILNQPIRPQTTCNNIIDQMKAIYVLEALF